MTQPESIFDPKHYAQVRRPVREARTLPPWCYHDPAFYRREVERIFMKGWNFVGHEGRLKESGDFAAIDYAGVPVILTRGRDGQVRAFANSCRHRGAQLVEGTGNCRAFKCPYHGWVYGLDGKLTGAPEMDRTACFEKAENGLIPVRLESFCGMMWISFNPEAPPLSDWLGDLKDKIAPYYDNDLVLVRRTEYDVACNWKVYVENFMDYYHTPTVHAQSLAAGQLSVYHRDPPQPETGSGEYLAMYARHAGSSALLPGAQGFPEMDHLPGRLKEGSTYCCVDPCALIAHTKDCLWYVEIHPTGPASIKLAVGSLFPRKTVERPDFQEVAQQYYKRWDVSVIEDNDVNELQQRGVSSPLALAGRVSDMEHLSHIHRNWVLDRMIANAA